MPQRLEDIFIYWLFGNKTWMITLVYSLQQTKVVNIAQIRHNKLKFKGILIYSDFKASYCSNLISEVCIQQSPLRRYFL